MYGSIWEALPSIEYILSHLENLKSEYKFDDYMQAKDVATDAMTTESRKYFKEAINNAWVKLDEYYTRMDESPVYAASVALNPSQMWHYMEEKWGSNTRQKTQSSCSWPC